MEFKVKFEIEREVEAESEAQAKEEAQFQILDELLHMTHWDLEQLGKVEVERSTINNSK